MSALNYFVAAVAFALLGFMWMAVNLRVGHSGFARFISYVNMWSSFLAATVAVAVGVWRWLA